MISLAKECDREYIGIYIFFETHVHEISLYKFALTGEYFKHFVNKHDHLLIISFEYVHIQTDNRKYKKSLPNYGRYLVVCVSNIAVNALFSEDIPQYAKEYTTPPGK